LQTNQTLPPKTTLVREKETPTQEDKYLQKDKNQ